MKKLYIEPEFELVNIMLTADVLRSSQEAEGDIPDSGDDFEDDFGDSFGDGNDFDVYG